MDPAHIALWTTALIGIGTVVAGAIKFGFWVYDQIASRRSHSGRSTTLPKQTLRIALKDEHAYWWHMGSRAGEPIMQVVGDFFITNVSSEAVRLPQMELRHGLWGRKHVRGAIMVEGPGRYYGMYDIEPNDTRDSRADFWVYPPVRKPNEPFTVYSAIFYDQFGNKHVVKKLRFNYT
jgi:hypothetical protein